MASASVADDGTLLIATESDAAGSFELIALNRSGQGAKPVGTPAAEISSPAVSQDSRHVAMLRSVGGQRHVWVQETAGSAGVRLTFDDVDYGHPKWLPSGDRLLYSERGQSTSGAQVFAVAADGSGKRQPLTAAHRAEVSPDGRDIVYLIDDHGAGRLRYRKLELGGAAATASTPRPELRVFKTDPEPDVRDFTLSPDGRLLAYVDYKAGRADLLVTRYPTGEGKWQVVANGGRALYGSDDALRWVRGTNELFFPASGSDPDGGRLMAATVHDDARAVTIGQPAALFELDADAFAGGFDVTPDGKTFFIRRRPAGQPKIIGRRFVLVQNWPAEFTGTRR